LKRENLGIYCNSTLQNKLAEVLSLETANKNPFSFDNEPLKKIMKVLESRKDDLIL
jgi:hypothetical protein